MRSQSTLLALAGALFAGLVFTGCKKNTDDEENKLCPLSQSRTVSLASVDSTGKESDAVYYTYGENGKLIGREGQLTTGSISVTYTHIDDLHFYRETSRDGKWTVKAHVYLNAERRLRYVISLIAADSAIQENWYYYDTEGRIASEAQNTSSQQPVSSYYDSTAYSWSGGDIDHSNYYTRSGPSVSLSKTIRYHYDNTHSGIQFSCIPTTSEHVMAHGINWVYPAHWCSSYEEISGSNQHTLTIHRNGTFDEEGRLTLLRYSFYYPQSGTTITSPTGTVYHYECR